MRTLTNCKARKILEINYASFELDNSACKGLRTHQASQRRNCFSNTFRNNIIFFSSDGMKIFNIL